MAMYNSRIFVSALRQRIAMDAWKQRVVVSSSQVASKCPATSSSSSQSITSSASPKKNVCYFSWNLSHLYRQPINLCGLSAGRRYSWRRRRRCWPWYNSLKFWIGLERRILNVSNTNHLFHNYEVQLTTAPSSPARRALITLLVIGFTFV